MSESICYQVTVTTLSPLHVGSGQRLREGFDFIEHDGYLWVADQSALLRAILEEATLEAGDLAKAAERITGMTLYELQDKGWLRTEHFDPTRQLFHYQLPGSTTTKKKQGELHEQIKNVFGEPYLPGSSLKGALRSALLRRLAERDPKEPEIWRKRTRWEKGEKVIVYDGRAAARNMEMRHFVPASVRPNQQPNYDLWRAFRVSDSAPISSSALSLAHTMVFPVPTKGKAASNSIPLDVEVIQQGISLTLSIQVESWLFRSPEAAKLRFEKKHLAQFTKRLRNTVCQDAKERLWEDLDFFHSLSGQYDVKTTIVALSQLVEELGNLEDNEMLLQVGKGPGWRSKTLGRVLQNRLSDDKFKQLGKDFNLGRGLWRKDGRVPLTRQLATTAAQVRVPLGWIKVTMDPRS